MQLIDSFNPQNTPNGDRINVGAIAPCSPILIYNDSPVGMAMTLPDGSSLGVSHAFEARIFKVDKPVQYIDWTVRYTLDVTNEPNSVVNIEVYTPQEPITGTYPLPLVRVTNTGNPNGVNTNVSSTNSLQNDNNPLATVIVEATPQGSTVGSYVIIRNDGLFTLYSLNQGVAKEIITIAPGYLSSLVTALFHGVADASNALQILNVGGKAYFLDASGNSVASIDSSGNLRIKGTLTQNTTP